MLGFKVALYSFIVDAKLIILKKSMILFLYRLIKATNKLPQSQNHFHSVKIVFCWFLHSESLLYLVRLSEELLKNSIFFELTHLLFTSRTVFKY